MKYKLGEKHHTQNLYRVVALKDFSNVKEGEVGGWVEGEHNLSQDGNCWVYENARVSGNVWVSENALVYGNALVSGNVWVCKNAQVYGDVPPKREWVGLTQQEVRELWFNSFTPDANGEPNSDRNYFADAIEAKLKEKNT